MDLLTKNRSRRGFSLIEMVVALAIFGITSGMFYMVWGTNLATMDQHILRADLWDDANGIVENISRDAREAEQINVAGLGTPAQTATLFDQSGNTLATYRMDNTGILTMNRAGWPLTQLSDSIDYLNSRFELRGRALVVTLSLAQRAVDRNVVINSSTEIYPRN